MLVNWPEETGMDCPVCLSRGMGRFPRDFDACKLTRIREHNRERRDACLLWQITFSAINSKEWKGPLLTWVSKG